MKNINNEKGQAIFEFIIFLPFLVFMFTIFYTAGNSINGSINQQKATRGYYYTLVKNNTYLLTETDLARFSEHSLKRVGFFAIGWREKGDDSKQYGNCFKFMSLLKGTATEECDSEERIDDDASAFVRVFTSYGVCGGTYFQVENSNLRAPYVNMLAGQTSRPCILGGDTFNF